MAVKDETGSFPTESLIAKEPRRHYQISIKPIHWQLRSLIGVSKSNKVYYPTGPTNQLIQELDTQTLISETVAVLGFSPRCLVVRNGWLCCGGEAGEFSGVQVDTSERRVPRWDDEYDDEFYVPLTDSSRVPRTLRAKSRTFGEERVNCITIWTPSALVAPAPVAYDGTVAVLANNDCHVTFVRMQDRNGRIEQIERIEYPDCVNRAVLSPDGRLLVAISDDPYLYIHERVERSRRREPGRSSPASMYRWKLLARHHLKGQNAHDHSVRRGSFAACFSNTGHFLAIGTQYGVISVFDTALLGEPGQGLVACFSSSNPQSDAGAVREMSFCPGAYDLLAWSEDDGAVGVADVRSGFVSRQILPLGDDAAYEHVSVDVVQHLNADLTDEQRLQQRRLRLEQLVARSGISHGTSNGNLGNARSAALFEEGVRSIFSGSRLPVPAASSDREGGGDGVHDAASSSEQAVRIRDALDLYELPRNAWPEIERDPQLQLQQQVIRAREREQRELQQHAESLGLNVVGEDQLQSRERTIQDYLRRRPPYILQSRLALAATSSEAGGDSSASSANNANNTNEANDANDANDASSGTGASPAAGRVRQRNESMTATVNDILGSLRSLRSARDAAQQERRRLNGILESANTRTAAALSAASLSPFQPSRRPRSVGALARANNEGQASDDENDNDDDTNPTTYNNSNTTSTGNDRTRRVATAATAATTATTTGDNDDGDDDGDAADNGDDAFSGEFQRVASMLARPPTGRRDAWPNINTPPQHFGAATDGRDAGLARDRQVDFMFAHTMGNEAGSGSGDLDFPFNGTSATRAASGSNTAAAAGSVGSGGRTTSGRRGELRYANVRASRDWSDEYSRRAAARREEVLAATLGLASVAPPSALGSYKDNHTAGLAWSEDGQSLFVGGHSGIYEFHINLKARQFHPSIAPR